jgi:hypothetical protein
MSFEKAAASPAERKTLETPGAVSACRTDAERKAVLGAFMNLGGLAANVLACATSADAIEAQSNALSRGLQRFFDDPENEETCCEALSGFMQVKALAHLEVGCDAAGSGHLELKWFARRLRGRLVKLKREAVSRFTKPVPLTGAVLQRWHRCLPSFTFDSANLPLVPPSAKRDGTRREEDALARYHRGFLKYTRQCKLVVIGRLGVDVARGSCDLNPHCEFKTSCRLFLDECVRVEKEKCAACPIRLQCRLQDPKRLLPKAWPGPWRRRMAAVDLLFMEGAPVDRAAQAGLIQAASLVNSQRIVQRQLEESLLRALPGLPQREQRAVLRRLFDRCRAIEDPQRKGAAFEQLATGILRLVPGWMPSRRNLHTPENELDFAVFVEPAIPAAQYWFSIFGPKILIECKNYPYGLPTRLGRKRENPVIKLYSLLRRSHTKLALLLNTGGLADSFRPKAQRMARPDRLVVLFDGAELARLIDSPGDAEDFFKQRVSDAAIRASELVLAEKPRIHRRKRIR